MNESLKSRLRVRLLAEEGIKLKPYKDTEGFLTIGVGRCIEKVGISTDEALLLLDHDIESVVSRCATGIPFWHSLDETRQLILTDMAFQLGISGLLEFRHMLAALAAGDHVKAVSEMLDSDWAKQTPTRAHGLAILMEA